MSQSYITHDEFIREALRAREDAQAYLDVSFEEYEVEADFKSLAQAVWRVADAPQDLLTAMTPDGSTRFDRLLAYLREIGFQISFASPGAAGGQSQIA